MFWHLKKLAGWEETGLPVLRYSKGSAGSTTFIWKPTNPEFIWSTTLLSNSHTPSQYFPCPKPPRQLETTLTAQSLLESLRLASGKLFTLSCLVFPMDTPIRALALAFPSLLSFVPWPQPGASPVAPYGVVCPLLLGNVRNKFFLQWHWPLPTTTQSPP